MYIKDKAKNRVLYLYCKYCIKKLITFYNSKTYEIICTVFIPLHFERTRK